MKSFRLDFDRDYGIDRRTGWSISVNGGCLVMFERSLIVALFRALFCTWPPEKYDGGRHDGKLRD
jgi:hypothetical protein